jgi:hypothetical protein
MIALAVARAKRREGAIDRIADFSASPPALIEIADQVDDSTASSRIGPHKPWYDGGGGPQIWPLLERQKSQ